MYPLGNPFRFPPLAVTWRQRSPQHVTSRQLLQPPPAAQPRDAGGQRSGGGGCSRWSWTRRLLRQRPVATGKAVGAVQLLTAVGFLAAQVHRHIAGSGEWARSKNLGEDPSAELIIGARLTLVIMGFNDFDRISSTAANHFARIRPVPHAHPTNPWRDHRITTPLKRVKVRAVIILRIPGIWDVSRVAHRIYLFCQFTSNKNLHVCDKSKTASWEFPNFPSTDKNRQAYLFQFYFCWAILTLQ